MKTMKFLSFGLMILALTLTSCSVEDGDAGPQGVAGVDGADGADGLDGADGTDGADGLDGADGTDGADGLDGNANVVSILFENVAIVEGNNDINIPELTQDIFDNGLVYVYAKAISTTFWEPLPISNGGSVIFDINRVSVGSVQLTATFNQNLNIRFVLVEGNDVSGVDFSNFDQVQKHFEFK